jgi:hypothetical protein
MVVERDLLMVPRSRSSNQSLGSVPETLVSSSVFYEGVQLVLEQLSRNSSLDPLNGEPRPVVRQTKRVSNEVYDRYLVAHFGAV